jgi:hypothetical protein
MECGAHSAQNHTTQYPTLAHMAWDYLPIQGLATPSERVFSNASLTDSEQCNQLAPDTFEALQILKSTYHNGHMSAPAEAQNYYDKVMNVLGGEDRDTDRDGLVSSFL